MLYNAYATKYINYCKINRENSGANCIRRMRNERSESAQFHNMKYASDPGENGIYKSKRYILHRVTVRQIIIRWICSSNLTFTDF